ncbi:PASTA domain-containing protein [Streptomyces scabiei]|uniref:PASTA domain-containing protein n=1 Tax=Streptomyces TaxID=1883 RepID=UPI001FF0AC6E|nr:MULTISPECIES: PASTA domain-containing protein [Streptomyces]MDW8471298.1 PASTA domain-containing protein [Streptomyces scabiei]MDX2569207.1 PASTA domain-containing protein [Streptomyces scabiei]MDX2628062.1 PASTA domain-containing protein [Streptomyces scabiei]MDX3147881.1 PASTA domain-containing protein [Streptomyces scabiei]MDX3157002.1 PASTA domain-containing protein [Streptomyces scabiei]
MTIHVCPRTHLRKAGKSAARRIAVALCGALLLGGCGDSAPSLLAVKAVAAGVASLAPFFDEGEQLGRDEPRLTPLTPHSGLQQGNAPGLYGGTQKPTVCDVRKLEDFLAAPENEKKAQEWARVTGVKADGIGRYLDSLTPVLLRHDTLVKNHDYKKGRAVPFDALLEAGIAVLVDDQGLPAVKCSCGNPLRAFDADPGRIDVEFPGDKEWKGYDASGVVVVEPAPERLKEIKLVDVEDPDRGISRAVGTTGESDTTFDARARQAVPTVRGMTFGEASAALADRGLAATVAGGELPPDDTPVTGSSPGPGAELEFGAAVALRVEEPGGTAEESSGEPGSSGPGSGSGAPGSEPGSSSGPGPGSTRLGPTEPSESGGSPAGGAPSESGSTPTDGNTPNTPPAGGGSSPSAGGSSRGGTTSGTGFSDGDPSGSGPSGSGPSGSGPSGSGPSDGGPPGGGPSDGGSPGGGSVAGGSVAGGSAPAESVTPPTTGGTSFMPSPSTSFEKPAPEPDPTPSPSVPSSPSSASGLSTSSRAPAAPEPGAPTDPTDPTGAPRWPGLPVEVPAQPPVRI